MQGGFKKFKQKQTVTTYVDTLLFGGAAAMLSVGVLLLIAKLNARSLHWLLYVLVPVVAFGIAAGVAWLCLRKKDKKLAKTLDEQFALNDRVQTMIEFEQVQTDMVRLQREDAQEKLAALSPSKLKWKSIWVSAAAFVLAAATLVTGLVIPKKKTETQPEPPTPPAYVFEITLAQRTALGTLIKNVKDSRADDEVKTALLTELEGLMLALDGMETETQLYTELSRIITVVDTFVEEHNTYKRVYDAMRGSEVETVQDFAMGIGLNDLPTKFENIVAAIENEEADAAAAHTALEAFTQGVKDRYAAMEEAETDGLVVAIATLITDLEEAVAIDPTKFPYEYIINQTGNALNGNAVALANALKLQTDNRTVTSDAIARLIAIFSLPAEWIPDWGGKPLMGLEDGTELPEAPEKPGAGIIIDGILYPSAETVYDYYTKIICEYGKVFEGDAYNYKAAINTLISEGIANGTITPEVEEMLHAYLDALSGVNAGDAI